MISRKTRQAPPVDMLDLFGSTYAVHLRLTGVDLVLTVDAYSVDQARSLIRQQYPDGEIEDVFLTG